MLTSEQIDAAASDVLNLYNEYETSVIADIARRLSNLNFVSAAWETQRLTESGALYQDVLRKLSKLTGQSEEQIAAALKKAGVKAIQFDDKIYKQVGLKPLPLNLSPAMEQVLLSTLEKTNGQMRNITSTTAITSQQTFIHAADLAHQQVATGAMSYDQAIRSAIKNIAAQGLTTIDYATGHQDKLDVATRRTVLTGVAQTANQLQTTRAAQMGSNLVAVSAHAGARNHGTGPMNHASWQGKVYSLQGGTKKYPNFAETTGYGTGEGLGGWNCRHSFYPFFEGVSEPAVTRAEVRDMNKQKVTYQGKEISNYDATQVQREIERKIRYWKRQEAAMAAAKLDTSQERAKVAQWQATMRDFLSQVNSGQEFQFTRQSVREQVLHP